MYRSKSDPVSILSQRGDASPLSPPTCMSAPTPRSYTVDDGVGSAVVGDGFGSADADDGVVFAVAGDNASSVVPMEEDNLPGGDSSKEDDSSHPWDEFSPKVGRSKGGLTSRLPKTKGEAPSQVAQIETEKKKFKPMKVKENPNEVYPPPTEFGPDVRASSLRRITSKELESFFLKKNRSQKTDKTVQLQLGLY
jgi:hypothetical protein